MSAINFSFARLNAIMVKEFIQMRRDRVTFAMIVVIPLMQLILFGYAINTNPRHLPTAIISADYSNFTTQFIQGLKNTAYFQITEHPKNVQQAEKMLAEGKVLFVISIPPNFTQNLIRGQRPQLLIEADATDPMATGTALSAVGSLVNHVFDPLLKGNLAGLRSKPIAINLVTHAKYNPENITQYNIVPGLIGVVLTMTMVMITSLAIVREKERGTMESLLATPVRPLEVMLGKITPYIIVGYIQLALILLAARFLFAVPITGNIFLLLLCTLPFIAANLALGVSFSSIASNQLQAVQMTFFFFLPSILLSGFMFPFAGMPNWAQFIGSILPLTYFLRITRGIMLKGNGLAEVLPSLWPIILFAVFAIFVGVKRYRQTLD